MIFLTFHLILQKILMRNMDKELSNGKMDKETIKHVIKTRYLNSYKVIVAGGRDFDNYEFLKEKLDETVVAIHNLTIPYYHNAHGANACALLVGSLKIYRCKILHECKVTNYRCIIQIFNIYISILVCPFPWQFLSCAWFHEICHPKKQQDVLP